MDARAPVEVEELRAPERVAPERILVRRRHVVRDDVEHDAEPGLARGRRERTELVLAAEVLRDARRIDHVVPVRRAVPRLERGREIEVRDTELARDTGRARGLRGSRATAPAGAGRWRAARPSSRPGGAAISERPSTGTIARARKVSEPASASGCVLESSSSQRRPNETAGSVKSTAPSHALKRIRNVSSMTGAPRSVRVGISEPLRKTPSVSALLSRQFRCVILRPSARNHQTSGAPEPSRSSPVRKSARRKTGCRMRRSISRFVQASCRLARSSSRQSTQEISLSWQ